MKLNNPQAEIALDSKGIIKLRSWRGVDCLSSVPTFHAISSIYSAIIDMNLHSGISDDEREEELAAFRSWFLELGSTVPALPGTLWLLLEIGVMILSNPKPANWQDDERLSRILVAFACISNCSTTPTASLYWKLIREGWINCDKEMLKESLYSRLAETFGKQGLHDATALGKKRGLSKSELDQSVARMSKKLGFVRGTLKLRDVTESTILPSKHIEPPL